MLLPLHHAQLFHYTWCSNRYSYTDIVRCLYYVKCTCVKCSVSPRSLRWWRWPVWMPAEFTGSRRRDRCVPGPRPLRPPSLVTAHPATHRSYRFTLYILSDVKVNVNNSCINFEKWQSSPNCCKEERWFLFMATQVQKGKKKKAEGKAKNCSVFFISFLTRYSLCLCSGGLARTWQCGQHPWSSKEEFMVHRRPGWRSQLQPLTITSAVTCRELLARPADERQCQQSGRSCELKIMAGLLVFCFFLFLFLCFHVF